MFEREPPISAFGGFPHSFKFEVAEGLEGCRLNLFNGKCLNLEWWNSEVGCIGDGVFAQKEWVFLCTCT